MASATVLNSLPLSLPPHDAFGASLYNALPSLGDADSTLAKTRTSVLAELGTLLLKYKGVWGVCLVHSHCTLLQGEAMVAEGNYCQPKMVDRVASPLFPGQWLSDGRPFEYTTEKTETPPQEIFKQLQDIAPDMQGVIGLYYAGDNRSVSRESVLLEHTEGRTNITKNILRADLTDSEIQTAWIPDSDGGMPIQMVCTQMCDWMTTRLGARYHTGKYHTAT
ncbi:hypothetical protein F5051DRAFT_20871 [Lentinula edodes]|nr:hypothetical protein F5051DRAFT_20871 [Lentinula edodes]